jgi:hypothetical protein
MGGEGGGRQVLRPSRAAKWIDQRLISGFRRQVDEDYALLGYYAASSGNFLPMFRDNLSVSSSRVNNDGRKVGEKLPLVAA